MSTTSGVFSETELMDAVVRAEALSLDSRIGLQYKSNAEVLKALRANQTAQITVLQNPIKDQLVKIVWMNACGINVSDATDCVFAGSELSTNAEVYDLTITKEAEFKVHDGDFVNNDFGREEAIAKGMLRAMKVLEEYYAQTAVAFLLASRGVNKLTNGKGTVSGNDTFIAPAAWDATLFAYFMRASTVNQFEMPFLISGTNLFEQSIVSAANGANADGKGQKSLFDMMKIYFDVFNVDQVTTPSLVTFMLSANAIAMAEKVRYGMVPTVYSTEKRWSMESKNIPGLKFDVHYKDECGADDFFTHYFKFKLKGGLFLNPAGCDADNTGVLSFTCGTGS